MRSIAKYFSPPPKPVLRILPPKYIAKPAPVIRQAPAPVMRTVSPAPVIRQAPRQAPAPIMPAPVVEYKPKPIIVNKTIPTFVPMKLQQNKQISVKIPRHQLTNGMQLKLQVVDEKVKVKRISNLPLDFGLVSDKNMMFTIDVPAGKLQEGVIYKVNNETNNKIQIQEIRQ